MEKQEHDIRGPEQKRRELYARVFGTPDGRLVARDIIEECHVLETLDPSSERAKELMALRNFGLEFMYWVGIVDESNDNDFMARIVSMIH